MGRVVFGWREDYMTGVGSLVLYKRLDWARVVWLRCRDVNISYWYTRGKAYDRMKGSVEGNAIWIRGIE